MTDLNRASKCLVLGGGGVAGIAWMTGLLYGLEKKGLDLSHFDQIIGTSAGAAVGAQITSGLPLRDLLQRQTDPALQVAELVPAISPLRLVLKLLPALLARRKPQTFRRRVGQMAKKSGTVAPNKRYRVIEERLPNHSWPATDLKIVVVNADSGDMRVLDQHSGVSLTDAVAASCAVPGIWPVVSIEGTPYIDGGIRSATNADLASGAESVLILAPMGSKNFLSTGSGLLQEAADLMAGGSRVDVLTPDGPALLAMGKNPLDPASRAPAALAGEQQAGAAAEALKGLF